MLQERKKDYLQRLIEEFFKKLEELVNGSRKMDDSERKSLLNDGFRFFFDNFDISKGDDVTAIAEKINNNEFLEQYAKLLSIKYDLTGLKDKEELQKALAIIEYIQKTESTYSWERTILREDILRQLDEKEQ